MKVLSIFISSIFLLILFTSFSNGPDSTFSLTINVDSLRNSKGIVQFGLYNTEGSIPDEKFTKYYKLSKAKIANNSSTIAFNNIPIGKYAVSILHDENNDGKINRGIVLPKEGIGFSNYQTIGFSNRPTFDKASFIINCDKDIRVKVIYMVK